MIVTQSDLHIYHLKTCDTCRKAINALGDRNPTLTDLRADGVPRAVLEGWLETLGDALVNTRSTTWRGLDATERARAPLDLLMDHPTLIKRPVIVADGVVTVGWTPSVRAKWGVS